MDGRHILIRGTVQGVGFRPFVYRLATRAGITGSVKNGTAGVTIDAFAAGPILDEFIVRLSAELPSGAHDPRAAQR